MKHAEKKLFGVFEAKMGGGLCNNLPGEVRAIGPGRAVSHPIASGLIASYTLSRPFYILLEE